MSAPSFDSPVAFVDVETTGGHPGWHRITEIAIVGMREGEVEWEWSSLVNPGCAIPPSIQVLTGITDEMVAEAPRFEDLAREVLERLDGRLFVAHNVRFDHGFVRAELRRAGRSLRRENRLGVDACCETCGDSNTIHLARIDGLTLCSCCLAVARGRKIFELHHIAGQSEGPTIKVCANCHAPDFVASFYKNYDDTIDLWNTKFALPAQSVMTALRDAGKLMAGSQTGDALDPIRYLKASDIADERLAERYLEMILQETERAVPSGTVANKALWVGQNQPGSFRGELMRSISMLKSYGTIVLMQDWGRVAAEIGRGRKLGGARFMASIVISSTLLGALAMQLKSLSRGEDPRPMDEPEFWGAALMQGGGMGIYGDYLFGSVNRFGGGFAGSLAGPVASRASNLWNLTGGNVIQFAQDEPTNFGRESVSFARMNLSMPFYLRLAYERVLLDELQKVADPEAYQAFRRKASKLKTQFKTGYWWAPGETGPRRAPDFGNIAP